MPEYISLRDDQSTIRMSDCMMHCVAEPESFEDGEPAVTFDELSDADDMFAEVDMSEYVSRALASIPARDRARVEEDLERVHLGPVLRMFRHATGTDVVRRTPVKKGGGEARAMFERALDLHDTLHDAKCRDDGCRAYVASVVMKEGDVLPAPKIGGATRERLTLRDVANHGTFVELITSAKTLDLGGEALDNSVLFGKDYRAEIMDRPVISGDDDVVRTFQTVMREKVKTHDERVRIPEFDGIEIWSTKNTKDDVAKIFRVAAFCEKMRRRYSGKAKFMMDIEHKMAQMLFQYKETDRCLGTKHIIVNEALGDVEHVINGETLNEWEFVQCDASVVDGMAHPGKHDGRRTGVASLPGSLVQVTFEGMSDSDVAMYTASSAHRPIPDDGVLKHVRNHAWIDPDDPGRELATESYSTSGVHAIAKLRGGDPGVVAHYAAMKRAADWGQVNHCVEYDMVFVTHDRPAFLYAIYMRCPAILMSVDSRYVGEGCIAYAFVMFAPTGCRERLSHSAPIQDPAIKTGRRGQAGGTARVDGTAVCAVAAIAVIIASLTRTFH